MRYIAFVLSFVVTFSSLAQRDGAPRYRIISPPAWADSFIFELDSTIDTIKFGYIDPDDNIGYPAPDSFLVAPGRKIPYIKDPIFFTCPAWPRVILYDKDSIVLGYKNCNCKCGCDQSRFKRCPPCLCTDCGIIAFSEDYVNLYSWKYRLPLKTDTCLYAELLGFFGPGVFASPIWSLYSRTDIDSSCFCWCDSLVLQKLGDDDSTWILEMYPCPPETTRMYDRFWGLWWDVVCETQSYDSHPEYMFFAPFCDNYGNCTEFIAYEIYNLREFFGTMWEHVNETPSPDTVISELPESVYVALALYHNIARAGGGFPESDFVELLDSTSAWMTVWWVEGSDTVSDTIHYGDPGTFWLYDSLQAKRWSRWYLPFRRFGVLLDSTDVPSDYRGYVKVCIEDVTNAPVVRYGEPLHLDPVRAQTLPLPSAPWVRNCVPAPPNPVCWQFCVGDTGGVRLPIEEPRMELHIKVRYHSSVAKIIYISPGDGEVLIYDIIGRVVYREDVRYNGCVVWDYSGYPDGFYFVVLRSGGRKVVRKIIVLK